VLRGAKVTQSIWKERSPRDLGAGWDFDDVRDHYVAELFHVDPVRLRYSDHERYLALGRVATGEVMSAVFSEWRRAGSLTRGGLVWFLRDLWPGAGWGIIDAAGNPKAAWYYLRRALAPVTLSISDEGCNGLTVHVANDDAQAFDGNATIALYRDGDVRVVAGSGRVVVAGHGVIAFNAMSLLDGFHDLSYAYRFGPPSHDVVAITLDSPRGPLCAVHFIGGMPSHVERDVGLAAELHAAPRGEYEAVVRTRRFAQAIRIELDGFVAADNYFHLCPGEERRISLHRSAPPQGRPQADNDAVAFRGTASALNSAAVAPLALGASND
jgi:beta-mannosidase